MASIKSFPTGLEGSTLANRHRPLISVLAYRPRKVGGIADCNSPVDLLSRRRSLGRQRVKAASAEDEAEDSLQATIEKSKKVLAIQKDLLQQVLFFSFLQIFNVHLFYFHTCLRYVSTFHFSCNTISLLNLFIFCWNHFCFCCVAK